MTSELLQSRNRLIAGLLILLLFVVLICYFLFAFLVQKPAQPKIGHHSPVDTLAYCKPEQTGLCIVSFSQEVDGAMQIKIQTPYTHYPEIILIITQNGQESRYECEQMESPATNIQCTGASQVPGEILNFKIISKKQETLIAEGNFAIIGIALSTPVPASTATMLVTGTITETVTETPTATPTVPRFNTLTPVQTASPPSYPNPTSYP